MTRTLYWLHYFLRTRRRSGRTVEACLRDALEVTAFEAGPRSSLDDFSIDGLPFTAWLARQVQQ
jgi:hypothetical protein